MDDRTADGDLAALLAAAAGGDQHAWRALVERYSRRVYALLVRLCHDRELAEEITQATFVKLVEALDDYQESGRFEPWLFRIAANRLRDEMRRRKRQARPMGAAPGDGGEAGAWSAVEAGAGDTGSMSPLETMTRAEQLAQLRQAVEQLSEADREVIYMRHTAGLTFAQIAEALEQPIGTVLARGHRALAKLRKLMNEQES